MNNLNDIYAEAAREIREAEEAWEEKMKDYHDFDYFLDDEVMRCHKCGMNVLSNREFPKCEEYTVWNLERNRKLREAQGLECQWLLLG